MEIKRMSDPISAEERIQKLHELAVRLEKLTANPEPGLFSWWMMLNSLFEELENFKKGE